MWNQFKLFAASVKGCITGGTESFNLTSGKLPPDPTTKKNSQHLSSIYQPLVFSQLPHKDENNAMMDLYKYIFYSEYVTAKSVLQIHADGFK